MSKPKVSIIVPVYNVEKYLRQCLESVINQTLKEIEIICIDDGSPDNCGAIIDEYAQKDTRIVAIHKENGGYGFALNYGFSIAKGEYIGIVESDDWIAPNMYELLYNKAIETNSDIVKSAFYYVENSSINKMHLSKLLIELYKKNSSFKLEDCPKILTLFASIWSAIYKRDWMQQNNIKMVEDIRPYEDNPFLADTYSQASKITIIPEGLYFYRLDATNSSCNTIKKTILNYVTQKSRCRNSLIKHQCYSKDIMEYYWVTAYQGTKFFYKKPNNKFKKEFYNLMKELYRKAKQDNCEFKYFKLVQIQDFNNILKFSFEEYQIYSFINNILPKIFTVKNTSKHKILTIFGLNIKFSQKLPRYIITIGRVLDKILPKNNKKIIFCSYPDYSDNAKEFFEYLYTNHKNEYNMVWLCQNPKDVEIPVKKYKIQSLRGLSELLTAKYTVNTFFDLEKFINSKKRINLQLWHGMPVKTIGYTEKNIPYRTLKAYKRNQNSFFFVTSDIFKISMIASFLMHPNKVYITGQPKTDCIFKQKNMAKIKDFIHADKFSKIVIYAPTYKEALRNCDCREVQHEFNNIFYMDDYSQEQFYKLLEDKNMLFIIKPHPFEEKLYRNLEKKEYFNHPNIKILYNSDMKNNNLYFYEFFQIADLMITDFSSIGIDYLLTQKPIIFLNSLAEEYNKNRGFILEDNYEIMMPGEKVYNFNQLLKAIEDAILADSWKEQRLKMLPLLHKYCDSNASERVYKIMKGLK